MEKGVLATRVWKYGPHKNAGVRMCVCVCVVCVCVCVCVCVVFFFTASKKSGNILRIMLILRQLYQKFCCSYD